MAKHLKPIEENATDTSATDTSALTLFANDYDDLIAGRKELVIIDHQPTALKVKWGAGHVANEQEARKIQRACVAQFKNNQEAKSKAKPGSVTTESMARDWETYLPDVGDDNNVLVVAAKAFMKERCTQEKAPLLTGEQLTNFIAMAIATQVAKYKTRLWHHVDEVIAEGRIVKERATKGAKVDVASLFAE